MFEQLTTHDLDHVCGGADDKPLSTAELQWLQRSGGISPQMAQQAREGFAASMKSMWEAQAAQVEAASRDPGNNFGYGQ